MADVRPFRGIRYNRDRFGGDLSELVCPPFDMISPEVQERLYRQHPQNMVRLELPGEAESDSPYEQAARTCRAWLSNGIVSQEPAPALYAYQLSFDHEGAGYNRRGVVAALRLEPWERGVVRPHEKTLPHPKEDRLRLMRACQANFSPIWGVYLGGVEGSEQIWRSTENREPDAFARDSDGARHFLWVISDPALHRALHRRLSSEAVYIVDGHHRYETALGYRDELRAQGGPWKEDTASNFLMAYLVERGDPGLLVLPIHRLLRFPRPIESLAARDILGQWFDLDETDRTLPQLYAEVRRSWSPWSFGLWAPAWGLTALARLKSGEGVPRSPAQGHSDAWRKLDVAALHLLAIDRLFPEGTSALVEGGHLTWAYSFEEVEGALASGAADVAFLLGGTPLEAVLAVADAGDRMPEKSTYFYPKPVTGAVMASLAGEVPVPTENL